MSRLRLNAAEARAVATVIAELPQEHDVFLGEIEDAGVRWLEVEYSLFDSYGVTIRRRVRISPSGQVQERRDDGPVRRG